ncbi:MAG TPA: hypothetical protein VEQ40_06855 [Pyrinomonadaceae bacterium]|nr:hypothetical protein [Pyrinomonadaceae bacterium]
MESTGSSPHSRHYTSSPCSSERRLNSFDGFSTWSKRLNVQGCCEAERCYPVINLLQPISSAALTIDTVDN